MNLKETQRQVGQLWTFVAVIILSGLALSVEVCRLGAHVEALERTR